MDCDNLEVISLHYDYRENVMTYQTGEYADDIVSKLLSPERLSFLKQTGGVEYISNYKPNTVYEIDFPIPDDYEVITLYYEPETNMIYDDDGWVLYNIFSLITPQDLMLFKNKMRDMRVYGRNGRLVDLIYSDY